MNIISAKKVFTGYDWLHDVALIIHDDRIEKIVSIGDVPAGSLQITEGFIAPAFIDVQVYGAASRLLAVYPQADTLRTMQKVFMETGTVLFQPTLATNSIDVFKKGIDAVRTYWDHGGTGVHGLHLEGPWLSPAKRGAHIEHFIHAPSIEEVKDLFDYGEGVISMVTLAPEVCSEAIIALIRSYDIVVAAGHSSATYQQAIVSFNNGIDAVTHLYNAMSGLHHREPGLVGATLHHDHVCASIIPDGHHVDYAAIAIAKEIMGDRLFAITDAVTETTEDPYQHQLNGDKYECNGVLSGSSLTMHRAFLNLVRHVGLSVEESLRMCSTYPARLLDCHDRFGKIQEGATAQIIHLSASMQDVTVLNGKKV